MPCPQGSGNRCVEIQLPMRILVKSSLNDSGNNNHGRLESKWIYVPSGCYENKEPHHPLNTESTKNKTKKGEESQERGHSDQIEHL